jgi:hypothetical protein
MPSGGASQIGGGIFSTYTQDSKDAAFRRRRITLVIASALCAVAGLAALLAAWLRIEAPEENLLSREICLYEPDPWINGQLVVSSDYRHAAYPATRGHKEVVVVDGMEGNRYDSIGKGSLVFSPNSRRVAYFAGRGRKPFLVVDGVDAGDMTELSNPVPFSARTAAAWPTGCGGAARS